MVVKVVKIDVPVAVGQSMESLLSISLALFFRWSLDKLAACASEAAYVRKAEAVLKEAELWRAAPANTEGYRPGEFYCRVLERSIYDGLSDLCYEEDLKKAEDRKVVPEELRFDAVYFSGSLTLMPDPPAALNAVLPVMKTGGRIFITQTFQKRHSSLMAFIKPLMKYITTIDFGQLTTEEDLEKIISQAASFETVENQPIPNSINNGLQTARLVILKPKKSWWSLEWLCTESIGHDSFPKCGFNKGLAEIVGSAALHLYCACQTLIRMTDVEGKYSRDMDQYIRNYKNECQQKNEWHATIHTAYIDRIEHFESAV